MGDTAISLHIRAPRNSGGGGGPDQLNPKCQDLSKSAFSGGGQGVVQTNSTQSAKICPNLHSGGGIQTNSTQSAKICPNQHFWVGGERVVVFQTNIPEILEWGHSRNFEPRILATGMCNASQIVSHILRMWRLKSFFNTVLNTNIFPPR